MYTFRRFISDETGATAIEYAILAALVGIGMIAGLNVLGDGIDQHYNDINDTISDA